MIYVMLAVAALMGGTMAMIGWSDDRAAMIFPGALIMLCAIGAGAQMALLS